MKFIVIGYYTRNTFYEDHARVFVQSMEGLNIPFYVEPIDDLGGWHKNTAYKPTFIKRMLQKFPDCNLVYNDVDAEFLAFPKLFEDLDCNIAVHRFDRRNHPQVKKEGYEILSGTIFLKNCPEVFVLVERWEAECKKRPKVWDQKSLAKILQDDFYNLPPQYCKIFDVMKHVKDAVIIHYQASREWRKRKSLLVVSSALSKAVS